MRIEVRAVVEVPDNTPISSSNSAGTTSTLMPLMTASLPIFLRVAASIRAAILSKGLGIDLDVNDGTV